MWPTGLILFLILALKLNNCLCINNIGTEESLRQDIIKFVQGKLDFSDGNIPRYNEELPDSTPKNHSEYDFIVIGAGSAGATIASRLSEIEDVTVLLIEAGSKEYPIMDIPFMAVPLQFNNEINWNYKTESSDQYCRGLTDCRCPWPRAKVMGGSSVFNYMLATRGNRRDYDGWANLTNDDSWSYEKMLKYLKKLENFEVLNVQYENELHNEEGPVYITSPPYNTPLGEAFIAAGEELGYSVTDYNGRDQIGFSYFQSTIKNGERWSTNRAYLHSIKGRPNLFLTRSSFVTKVLIDESTNEAYGVQFMKDLKTFQVIANKEVILSAGAINSPQILMLSGVGPANHLNDLNIDVIKSSPVGENLMDHLAYGGLVFEVNDSQTFDNLNLVDPRNPAIKEYVAKRNGSLALGSGFEALGYVNVDEPYSDNDDPNIELLFGGSSGMKDPILMQALGVNEKYKNEMIADEFNHSAWTVWPMLMKPKSRGQLLLNSKDPAVKPKLYANYLSHPDDVATAIKGIRFSLKLSQTKAFQKYGSKLYQVPLPCQDHEFDSDDYWECALRTYTFTIYHQSGTCKMGRENDETAVVNPKLQVIGIKRLRVVDASIMPFIVSAHPNIPIIAIAEKLSDVIKKDWGYEI